MKDFWNSENFDCNNIVYSYWMACGGIITRFWQSAHSPQISQFDITIPSRGSRWGNPSSNIRQIGPVHSVTEPDETQIHRSELALATDRNTVDSLGHRTGLNRIEQSVEVVDGPRDQFEHA